MKIICAQCKKEHPDLIGRIIFRYENKIGETTLKIIICHSCSKDDK